MFSFAFPFNKTGLWIFNFKYSNSFIIGYIYNELDYSYHSLLENSLSNSSCSNFHNYYKYPNEPKTRKYSRCPLLEEMTRGTTNGDKERILVKIYTTSLIIMQTAGG